MKIYLASPLFTDYEKNAVYKEAKMLREQGHEVYVPMEHKIENADNLENWDWAKKVFDEDIKALNACDMVVCLYYGLYSDSGTAWECGYAYALGKRVRLIDYANDEVSLMVVNGSESLVEYLFKSQT